MKKILLIFMHLVMAGTTAFCQTGRISVLPVFFLPADSDLSKAALAGASELLGQHLQQAQRHYREILRNDTFSYTKKTNAVYKSRNPNSYFVRPLEEWKERSGAGLPDSAHMITRELFDWREENRYTCIYVYLVIYVRPGNQPYAPDINLFGGGRSFNGPPGSGGGYIEMEHASLTGDAPYPFQSTLVHEIGHAFGLLHVDAFGYDMKTNTSLMSYNPAHHTQGLSGAKQRAGLNPEEFYMLSLARNAFPRFLYDPAIHNPAGKEFSLSYLGRMDDSIGGIKAVFGRGYELFFNGKRVNGDDAAFYTIDQAKENRDWNLEHNPRVELECRYNGLVFYPEGVEPFPYGTLVFADLGRDGRLYPSSVDSKKESLYFIRALNGKSAWLDGSRLMPDRLKAGDWVLADRNGDGNYTKARVTARRGTVLRLKYGDGKTASATLSAIRVDK